VTDTKRRGGRKPTGTVDTLADGRLQGIITKHGPARRGAKQIACAARGGSGS
jgi:hypothetical protein